ncbi:hypothetical protein TRFO_04681 [Tritrichomonas foetus]|uniref:Ubiquitin-like domain-containing protein n=1 Tax=Tritrichomonas foetus TaxID=1144522 RepID=A0A1J4KHF5_9EUKA|nr:hypothetical protein TRFO_04681 [Tritrichomonas foetus]|eukprot:OHT09094.1 hypothetical protein TRFO_04681 [Tritrichomonas foetus]
MLLNIEIRADEVTTYNVDPEDTILSLIEKIQPMLKVPVKRILLIRGIENLEKDRTFGSYNIQEGDYLIVSTIIFI